MEPTKEQRAYLDGVRSKEARPMALQSLLDGLEANGHAVDLQRNNGRLVVIGLYHSESRLKTKP